MKKPKKELFLILGGARSGKSAFALSLARQRGQNVLFVATAETGDSEMRQRIRQHRRSRPAAWRTLEEPLDVVERLRPVLSAAEGPVLSSPKVPQVVLLDCLTLWVSNLLLATLGRSRRLSDRGLQRATTRVHRQVNALLAAYEEGTASFIIVSNEVGMGIVPDNALARAYRDALGRANQLVAARADRVSLLVAGVPVEVKGLKKDR